MLKPITLAIAAFALFAGTAQAQSVWYTLQAPGQTYLAPEGEGAMPTLAQPWYAVGLSGGTLTISPIDKLVAGNDAVEVRELAPPQQGQEVVAKPSSDRYVLAMPRGTVFAFNAGDIGLEVAPGSYPSAIASPIEYGAGTNATISIAGEVYSLHTAVATRPDGKALDGSLSLFATSAKGERIALVPPPIALALSTQEIVWAGRLTPRSKLDLVIRRRWLTGEVDYVLHAAGGIGAVMLDPEQPVRAFSSGIENWMTIERPASQLHAADEDLAGAESLTIFEDWNAAYEKAKAANVPARMLERTLTFRGAPVQVTIDYLPIADDSTGGDSSSTQGVPWTGSAVVSVTYQGKTQALTKLGPLDDGAFTFAIGTIGNDVAIAITHQPHYNNQFSYRWVRRALDGRFVRTYVYQSQGC